MGSKVKAPAPRSYADEMNAAISAQESIQPRLLALERTYTPMYQQLQQESIGRQMDYLNQAYAKQTPESARLTTAYANTMAPAFGAIGASARSAYEQTLDPSIRGLLGGLGQQASEGLTLGSALSDAETRQAQQSARAAMTARGLTGNQAVAQEVLNTYGMGQQRQAQRQNLAASVYGLGQQSAGNAMNMYGGNMMGFSNAVSPMSAYGTSAGLYQGLGTQIFQPESQYNAQLISANRQEAMQAQIANAQRTSGIVGGLLGAAGSVIGGMATGGVGLFAGGLASGGISSIANAGVSGIGSAGTGSNFISDNFMATGR